MCAHLDNGMVKCWGAASDLGLGRAGAVSTVATVMGDDLPAVDLGSGHTVDSVHAGYLMTCALLDRAQTLKCWGLNSDGRLGLGDTGVRGDSPGTMGDALGSVDIEPTCQANSTCLNTVGSFFCE
eukprot:222204-Rhodomonas_salina.1